MAISLVNSTVVSTGEVSTFDITVPSWGQEVGDFWLLMVSKDDDGLQDMVPDAQLVEDLQITSTASRDSRHLICHRVHDGNENAAWTINMRDTESAKYILSLWRGVDTDDPWDSVSFDWQVYANQGGNPGMGFSLGDPNSPDNMLINFTGGNDSTTIDLTEPASMTMLEASMSTAISVPYIAMAYEQLASAANPGGRSWTDAGYLGDGVNGAFYLKTKDVEPGTGDVNPVKHAETHSDSGTSIMITLPDAGQVSGDVWLLQIMQLNTDQNWDTVPAGWDLLGSVWSQSGTDLYSWVYARQSDGADAASTHEWINNIGGRARAAALFLLDQTYVDTGDFPNNLKAQIEQTYNDNQPDPMPFDPTLTPIQNNSYLYVSAFAAEGSQASLAVDTANLPSGVTRFGDDEISILNAAFPAIKFVATMYQQATAAAVSGFQWTGHETNDDWVHVGLVIRPTAEAAGSASPGEGTYAGLYWQEAVRQRIVADGGTDTGQEGAGALAEMLGVTNTGEILGNLQAAGATAAGIPEAVDELLGAQNDLELNDSLVLLAETWSA